MDKDAARSTIAELVRKYQKMSAKERSATNEQQTRLSLILPLFEALGWDTANAAEVSAEEKISSGFADFGFYLNGVPVFYLESKRLREGIDKIDHIRQAINYAYLKGVTWAVLTDFDALAVYNAEWETDHPEQALVFSLSAAEYADGRFDDLWLLSREAMQNRELDRFAERFGVKRRKQPITDVLLEALTGWRHDLFQRFTILGDTLWSRDARAVDNAIQRLFDRLIFLRASEDRGIESAHLKEVVRQPKASDRFPALLKLFREMDAIYNSNLFAEHELDHLSLHDPDLLKAIIDGLYKVPRTGYGVYDFRAVSADILGKVYEGYLGFKAQDPQGKKSVSGEKSAKRKAQGIFYTPQFVVRYIVQNTLGKLLESGADPHTIRVLDPACGSGSFLIEAFDVLDRWIKRVDPDLPDVERRRRILTENLYGVDLDEQAAEVTRLNLILRASLERGKLPMLTHIQTGNSLVDDPDVAEDKAFKWAQRFPEVFDVTFGERGGFDVVIGNPPYGAKLDSKSLEYVRANYGKNAGTHDTYELFLIKAQMVLRDTGYLGMIIPSSWLTGDSFTASRDKLVSALKPDLAIALPFDVFENAYIDTAIVAFSGTKTETETCRVHYFPKKEKLSQIPDNVGVNVPVERIRGEAERRFTVMLSNEYSPIISKLHSSQKVFGDYFRIQRGVQPYSSSKHSRADIAARFLHAKSAISDKHLPELQGEELSRYFIEPVRKSYLEYSDRIASTRPIDLFQGERLVLRRLLTRQFRLQASHTSETMITTDNVLNLVPKKHEFDPYFALGILNSKIISWYYVGTSLVAQKDDFPQVHISALNDLPLPRFDQISHDQVVNHVTKLIALKQERAAVLFDGSDQAVALDAQIAYHDAQIDQQVYRLYGLTDDEIALVEAGA